MPSATDDEVPFPSLESSTSHAFARSHLSPDDAFISPPRRLGERSRSRRRKRPWRKLMWVKHSYPDNYTDQATFLENLQRNPRLKPYDFWPLVADSTVILQHVCSVIIFVVCFIGISQERVSPGTVTGWSSGATFVGWILWERWLSSAEDADDPSLGVAATVTGRVGRTGSLRRPGHGGSLRRHGRAGSIRRPLPLRIESAPPTTGPSTGVSAASSTSNLHAHALPSQTQTSSTTTAATTSVTKTTATTTTTSPSGLHVASDGHTHTPRPSQEYLPDSPVPLPAEQSRSRQRIETIKSAILIYCTLLGLSPVLKSLTRSTSDDSIWAMSFWLLAINIFFFDYSGEVGAKFPASLSTNAALMASTVLASLLPSTKQVFSLTLFSIEVFGLFPVFRRYVRHRSWRFHVLSSVILVLGAGLGVGLILGVVRGMDLWMSGFVGMVVAVFVSVLATGGCSWWLIGLQKYKNEIRGPWDPARPIIMNRPQWDDS